MNNFLEKILGGKPFTCNMSRDARKLRDDVYALCFSQLNISDSTVISKFLDTLQKRYDPINWEKAVNYDYGSIIYEAILKRTSRSFVNSKIGSNPRMSKRGSKSKGTLRRKDIDWLELAIFNDHSFWFDMIDTPTKKISISPMHIDAIRNKYTEVYNIISNWLIVDFNAETLYHIYQFTRDYSIDFINSCISKIDNPSKFSTTYLKVILEKESALLKIDNEVNQRLLVNTQVMLSVFSDMVNNKDNIDWDDIDKKYDAIANINSEFKKIKLS